jgi:hypothetical protein
MDALTHGDLATVIIGFGLLIMAVAGFYLSSSSRYLTIREHQQYNLFILRELDQQSHRLGTLEQTRPTTGEIEARLNGCQFKKVTNA